MRNLIWASIAAVLRLFPKLRARSPSLPAAPEDNDLGGYAG